jgi:hypothetical protein
MGPCEQLAAERAVLEDWRVMGTGALRASGRNVADLAERLLDAIEAAHFELDIPQDSATAPIISAKRILKRALEGSDG